MAQQLTKNDAKWSRQHVRIHWRSSSAKGFLPPKVVFHLRSSSIKGCLLPKVVFHRRSSPTNGRLTLKVVFHQRLSSTKGGLPPKFVFHRRSSSTKGCLPPKVVFHRRTYRGVTHPQCNPTNRHTQGGDTPTVLLNEWTHRGGRTHNVTQRTETKNFFDETNKTNRQTNAQSHSLG